MHSALSAVEPALFYQPQGDELTLFRNAAALSLPVLLKGPTGCGKTRFVQHMAQRLKRPLYTVACHDDLSAADLVGRHLIRHDGTYWQDGPLTKAVREGGICYLDEVVEARKDTTVVLHPLADDRRELPIDRTGELLTAHSDFMLVVSYNPGYQNFLKGLKPSTRQRFVSISFDFPSAQTEVAIVSQESGVETAIAERLVTLAHHIRNLTNVDLEEHVSTRLLIYAGKLLNQGLEWPVAVRAGMIEPLSDDSEVVAALMEVVALNQHA